jgi:hypothetical protein
MESLKDVMPYFGLLVSVIGLLYVHFGVIMKLKDDMAKIKDDSSKCISDLQTDVGKIKLQTELFWGIVEKNVVNMIKNTPEDSTYDIYLEKFLQRTIKLDEAVELRSMLNEKASTEKDSLFGYVIILGRIGVMIEDLMQKECHEQRVVDSIR